MAAARRFNPIFTATVVPETVENLDGAKGPYTLMRNAVIAREGRPDIVRTVMAFGTPHSRVAPLLEAGRPIDLAIRFSGATITVVGLPKGADPAITAAPSTGLGRDSLAIRALYGIMLAHGLNREIAAPIIEAIVSGESDRISSEDEESPFDPDTIDSMGHILLPLIDAGVDHATAIAIAANTLTASALLADFLDDVKQLHEQTAARMLVAG